MRYDSVADISKRLCPLCEIHGTVSKTRDTLLSCHIQWDHAEVSYEWGEMDTEVSGLNFTPFIKKYYMTF